MEIQEERQIQIFHTLEKIERMNKAIQFHQVQENQDKTPSPNTNPSNKIWSDSYEIYCLSGM